MWNNKKRRGRLFIVSGSSGSGKTTLLEMLRGKKDFHKSIAKIVTVTTRVPRSMERNGRDYHFIAKAEFLRRKAWGEFAESEQIYGEYYGTPKKDLERILRKGNDALLCIDVKGALSLKRLFPKATVLIFIAAPSLKNLKERLKRRLSETTESMRKRLTIVKDEMRFARYYHYVIVNEVLSQALKNLSAVILAERLRVDS